MSAPVVFTDLYKPVKDFFSKGYNAQSIRFEGKAKGGDATLLTTFEQTATGITTSAEYEQAVRLASVPAIGKLVVNSNGRFQPSLKFKNPASLKGLTVSVNADQPTSGEKGKSDYVEASAEYVQPTFFAKTAVRPLEQTIDTSLTVAAHKFLLGGSVKANPKGLASYTVGASFKSPAIFFAGTYGGPIGSAAATTLGTIYAYKKHLFGAQVGLGKAITYEAGWESKCGDTTLKAKINNKQAVAVSAQHKISRIVATLSGELDVNKATVSKVGVKFLLEE